MAGEACCDGYLIEVGVFIDEEVFIGSHGVEAGFGVEETAIEGGNCGGETVADGLLVLRKDCADDALGRADVGCAVEGNFDAVVVRRKGGEAVKDGGAVAGLE